TTLPWGMSYPYAVVGWDKPPGVRVHPTPVYECLAYLAVFLVLWRMRRESLPDGAVFSTYLVLTGLARFLVEVVRIHPPGAFALIAVGASILVLRRAWRPVAA